MVRKQENRGHVMACATVIERKKSLSVGTQKILCSDIEIIPLHA